MYGSFGSFSSHFAWFDLLPLLLSCWYSLWIVFLFVYPKQWGGMRFLACLNSFVHSFIFTFFFHSSCYFFLFFFIRYVFCSWLHEIIIFFKLNQDEYMFLFGAILSVFLISSNCRQCFFLFKNILDASNGCWYFG